MHASYKGNFKPRHPEKYRGNFQNIVYRSGLELKFMVFLDSHRDVLQWASEEFCIRYRSPIDGRIHRYFPDFWIKMKNKHGQIDIKVVEIKPSIQTSQPRPQPKMTKKYINDVATWTVNTAKFEAAKTFCEDHEWTFEILTEKDLNVRY